MLRLGEEVPAVRDGVNLISRDGRRRFVPCGDIEWAWWVELDSYGNELPGFWEFWDEDGLAVCSCA